MVVCNQNKTEQPSPYEQHIDSLIQSINDKEYDWIMYQVVNCGATISYRFLTPQGNKVVVNTNEAGEVLTVS